jgi:serine phosphatase RsbU (regulator of sigma subunit)
MNPARLLIVDDNEMNRDMLSRRVTQQGYQFDMAENGRIALEMLNASAYDLVLLDIMMPEVNGYQVLETIKATETLRDIPVIMISAIDEIDNIARCIELGADDYLPKPFNATLLKARVSSSLEKKQLRDTERIHAKSLERELEIGRRIQAGFLPETLPQPAGWNLAAIFEPARMVAGDFYDAFALPTPNTLALVIADVCDKGVGAALFMALFRSLMRANSASSFLGSLSVQDALQKTIVQTNDYIAVTHSKANMFATMFFAALDLNTGLLTYINAGNEPPLLIRASGDLITLDPTGPAVGALPNMDFATAQTQIDRGDLLVCFTDGITEARSPRGEFFGDAALRKNAASAQTVVETIQSALAAFTGDSIPFDDITLMALKRLG